MDVKRGTKLLFLETEYTSKDTFKFLFEESKSNVEIVNINQYVIDINRYCQSILLIPDEIYDVINNYLISLPNPCIQKVILLTSNKNRAIKNQSSSSIHILDYIETHSNCDEIKKTINKYIKPKIAISQAN